jgi:hypothetical protein
MKTLKSAIALFAFLGFLLIGCSDQTQSPVSPSEKESLQKINSREFFGTNIPTGVVDPGIYKYPDGKIMMIKHKGPSLFSVEYLPGDTDPDILSGNGEVEINGITDLNTMIGHWYGKLSVIPKSSEAGGGKWEFTWNGEATFNATAWEGGPGWILPLKMEGHGNGGNLTGMQCRIEQIVYAPLDISIWTGEIHGFIYSH